MEDGWHGPSPACRSQSGPPSRPVKWGAASGGHAVSRHVLGWVWGGSQMLQREVAWPTWSAVSGPRRGPRGSRCCQGHTRRGGGIRPGRARLGVGQVGHCAGRGVARGGGRVFAGQWGSQWRIGGVLAMYSQLLGNQQRRCGLTDGPLRHAGTRVGRLCGRCRGGRGLEVLWRAITTLGGYGVVRAGCCRR